MSEVEEALKKLGDQYSAGLAQLHAKVEALTRSNNGQSAALKQQQAMFSREKWLIDKAREFAGGNQSALAEIDAVLRSRTAHAHTRLIAAMLLATIDSAGTVGMLFARIVDKSESDVMRFFCAFHLGASKNAAAVDLLLKAINDPSTDEEFDDDLKLRAKMIGAGQSVNLRGSMILSLDDRAGGASALAARVGSPLSFRNAWLISILSLWEKAKADRYIVLAAEVLKNRANPESLRLDAGRALYLMRRESRGQSLFPVSAWEAIRAVWVEKSFGKLHDIAGEILKLQGAA